MHSGLHSPVPPQKAAPGFVETAHAVQLLVPSCIELYVPSGHVIHSVEPSAGEAVPGTHG